MPLDPSKFKDTGFTHQPLIDRGAGAKTMRMNSMQVQPGAGSPDCHIHAFTQIYLIQDGEMTIEIGRSRVKAGRTPLCSSPPALSIATSSTSIERHVSLLVPEPSQSGTFDYAITIHDRERSC